MADPRRVPPTAQSRLRGVDEKTWVVVLVKSFSAAKQRLSAALDEEARRRLARSNACLAVEAAKAGGRVLVVAGGLDAAAEVRRSGVEVLIESTPAGQNPAARRGIEHALSRGAEAVLLLSSDLPLLTRRHVARLLSRARAFASPVVIAAPALGRGGTNALYLRPPGVLSLHFGDDSLVRFRAAATAAGIPFSLHLSPAFALDLDEPEDLERLRLARSPA